MPRSFKFPDVNDRSVNAPIFLVSPEQVLGFYNQENKKSQKDKITNEVKDWYISQVKEHKWTEARFLGNQCLLKVVYPSKVYA